MTHQELWQAFVKTANLHEHEYEAWAFGVEPDLLAHLVVSGQKTANASAYPLYAIDNEPLPIEGEYSVILDSKDNAVCVIQTRKVYVVPFREVTAEHAFREGEGDRSLAYWREVHERVFAEWMQEAGLTFTPDMEVVCEEFEVVFRSPDVSMTGGVFLMTERLVLRNVESKDAAVMYDYRNNEICSRYQRGQTKDYDGICALIEKRRQDFLSTDAPCFVAVALQDTDEMIGEIVVMPDNGTVSLGYTLHYDYHRKGYAFEALTALIDWLHERYPTWDFISFTDPRNTPSMALLEKLGYRHMGYLRSKDSCVFGKWMTPATEAEIRDAVAASDEVLPKDSSP